jgi:hypothetical protein
MLTFPTLLSIRQTVTAESEHSILRTTFSKLSWSHFQAVLRVSNEELIAEIEREKLLIKQQFENER